MKVQVGFVPTCSSSDALTSSLVTPERSAVSIELSFADFIKRLSDAIFCNRAVFVRLDADVTRRAHVISQTIGQGAELRERTPGAFQCS